MPKPETRMARSSFDPEAVLQVRLRSLVDQLNEFGVHEFVLVRDVQRCDRRQVKFSKCLKNASLVSLLHDEDKVCPLDVLASHLATALGAEAGRADLDSLIVAVDAGGGRASPLIPAANEEDMGLVVHGAPYHD